MVVDLHNMEFGECLVIHGNADDILMVDCGSACSSITLTGTAINEHIMRAIVPQYHTSTNKAFLLTHFHEDHYSGFKYILEAALIDFHRVYLPPVVLVHNRPVLIELALYLYAFASEGTELYKMSKSLIEIFSLIQRTLGLSTVRTLQQGDRFTYDGINYTVLWPEIHSDLYQGSLGLLEYIEALERENKEAIDENYVRFLELKSRFVHVYRELSGLLHLRGDDSEDQPITSESYSRIIELIETILNNIKDIRRNPDFINADLVKQVKHYLSLGKSRSIMKNDFNDTSIVFHSENQLLMTGDASPAVFHKIRDLLCPIYCFIKAPHHGTKRHYSPHLNATKKLGWIISNGKRQGYGFIDPRYSTAIFGSRCTNHSVCTHYQVEHTNCSRHSVCNELLIQVPMCWD